MSDLELWTGIGDRREAVGFLKSAPNSRPASDELRRALSHAEMTKKRLQGISKNNISANRKPRLETLSRATMAYLYAKKDKNNRIITAKQAEKWLTDDNINIVIRRIRILAFYAQVNAIMIYGNF